MTVRVYQTKGGLVGIECPGLPLEQIDRLEQRLVLHYNRNGKRYDHCTTVGEVNRELESVMQSWLAEPEKGEDDG